MKQIQSFVITSIVNLLAIIPLRLMSVIATPISWFLWSINGESKKIILQNLQLCFSEQTEAERSKMAKQRLKHLVMTALELGAAWCWSTEKLLNHMEIPTGKTLLDELVDEGKGVIVLAPHLGNWEILGQYVGSKHPIICLYQPPKIEAVNKLVLKSRARFTTALAPTNAKGVRMLLKALKRGEVVCILPDQVPPSGSGEYSPFFGSQALTMTLVYNLIQRTGASAVVSYAKRTNNKKYFQPVFKQVPQALYSDEQQESIDSLNKGIELAVLECPEQYQWEYKRFKKQRDGKNLYQ